MPALPYNKPMKKLFPLFAALTLLLSACGGSTSETNSTTPAEDSYFFTYKTAEFTIEVPSTWATVNAFPSDVPEDVRVAFRNNIQERDFLANVTVIRESKDQTISNADLSQEKLADHEHHLLNYTLISQEELQLSTAGSPSATLLNTFQGKNDASSPTLTFQQAYLTKGNEAWTITASYDPDEDSFAVEKMNHMLKSFTLR